MFLETKNEAECLGCEACVQVCPKSAIFMEEDAEGFRYPRIDSGRCIDCGLCQKVCPCENSIGGYVDDKYAFGGYINDSQKRFDSTSGGAFSAIVDAFCDDSYVIFGAEAKGLDVFHSYITDKSLLGKYRKSKYSQSVIGTAYVDARKFLDEGKKVLFSGTPCQIAGLRSYLCATKTDEQNLLTVEVICEGVPSPLYVRKLDKYMSQRHGSGIRSLDYRYTGKSILRHGKWDFQVMQIILENGKRIVLDRWLNPFWSVWLQHLMSRPSCYECQFTSPSRVADITLGDLWGVHLYCPELYGNNGGSSLVLCNTDKAKACFVKARTLMYGHELRFSDALKYQSPLKKNISKNDLRNDFIKDLQSDLTYRKINKKWAKGLTLKLWIQKYIWGNRQKVFLWNLLKKTHHR